MYKIVSVIYFACKVHFDLRKELEKTVTFSCFPLIRMFNNNVLYASIIYAAVFIHTQLLPKRTREQERLC